MLCGKLYRALNTELLSVRESGLFKDERIIASPQGAVIRVSQGEVLNFCSNNYLGLSGHPAVIAAAKAALDRWGYGLSSVRFICGTQKIHRQLEQTIARFLGMDDAILYSSCFDANGGLFESLMHAEDCVITDQLNHASIIDGIRLCKAKRYIYRHLDMHDLEDRLIEAQAQRFRLIVTDGVFSMDGDVAPLAEICALAEEYDALVMVDDSHATGFVGPAGRGTHEHAGVMGRVDIISSTLGKALGGASGGFIASHQKIVDVLRQRSRPYLFSNTLPPVIVATALKVMETLADTPDLREKLADNTRYFRKAVTVAGFDVKPGEHPIVPIMLYEAALAQKMSARLLDHGIYVIGFFYPVVPQGQARIRVQISAAHEREHLDRAIEAFSAVGRELRIIS